MRGVWLWWCARRELRRAFCSWCRSRPADADGFCSDECEDRYAEWVAIR